MPFSIQDKIESFYDEFSKLRLKVLRLRKDFHNIKKDIDVLDKRGFGVLSDRDITDRLISGNLTIAYVQDEQMQPASVDLTLGYSLKKLDGTEINLREEDYILQPNEFILGSTSEKVEIPDDLVGQVDGKSSIARLGVEVHRTAGWIDPGFKGNITLEIHNGGDKPFTLSWEMPICQIIFFTLTSPCERPYGHDELNNHYQNSDGTVLSRYGE